MSERLRIETIDEIFFPAPVRDGQGHIVPAPQEALDEFQRVKQEWQTPHPRLPHEEPLVSLGPTTKDGQDGYSVRKEIIYH